MYEKQEFLLKLAQFLKDEGVCIETNRIGSHAEIVFVSKKYGTKLRTYRDSVTPLDLLRRSIMDDVKEDWNCEH